MHKAMEWSKCDVVKVLAVWAFVATVMATMAVTLGEPLMVDPDIDADNMQGCVPFRTLCVAVSSPTAAVPSVLCAAQNFHQPGVQ